jgi:purine-cytosine permease-like protein
MNTIKKMLGLIWILLGPAAIYYLITTAASEIAKKPMINTKIQWGVFIGVFIPIAIGLMIFGYYALKDEYSRLPENSDQAN